MRREMVRITLGDPVWELRLIHYPLWEEQECIPQQ
jgi:hypothetical protein